jgi:hypothetical protein
MESNMVLYQYDVDQKYCLVEEDRRSYMKEQFNEFASNMMRDAYEQFTSEDDEFLELSEQINMLEKEVSFNISNLDDKERIQLKKYIQLKVDLASCSYEHLYVTGFKDCIKFLKELKVI